MSITGDPFTDALVPTASRIVWAVREGDTEDIDAALDEVRNDCGRVGIDALVIVLAAMVPDDLTPAELLAWTQDPNEYLRLREVGVDALSAGTLAMRKAKAA